MKILMCLVCLVAGCGDGNFDFSEVDNSQVDSHDQFIYEPNEGKPSSGDGNMNGSGANPVCGTVKGVDGFGGFLWKAESDSDGKLVVIFPKEFTEKFASVKVFNVLTDAAESGSFSAFANGERQHWRFRMAGSAYNGRVVAESLGGECVWQVGNPSERQD